MKISRTTIIVAVAFLFIVILSMYGGCVNVRPYSASSGLQGSPYEGFGPMLEYATYPDNQVIASDNYASKSIVPVQMTGDRMRIKGFDGLVAAPSLDDSSLDIYSGTSGKRDCQSYGLMNSNGYLCLDQTQVGLLTSRGGNATGV